MFKYFKIKNENEELKKINDKLSNDKKRLYAEIDENNFKYEENKKELLSKINQLEKTITENKNNNQKYNSVLMEELKVLKKSNEVKTAKISELKIDVHKKQGAIGGLTRYNNKLKSERKEMLDLMNKLIKERKIRAKAPTIEELKKYFRKY